VPSREEDFAALVERYSRLVASAIRRVCRDRHRLLIPDVQQDVYAALWKRLGSGKNIDHPASYLYKMALTAALAEVRKHMGEAPLEDEHVEMSDRGGSAPPPLNPAGDLLPAERRHWISEAIGALPLEQARAVRAHLAGFNHHEVAAIFGWTESVARHRIYRGLHLLKVRMKEGAG
jgi:RNA polymerase sigma factor (sigma-70 family)